MRSGIYEIRNLVTGDVYIGSTVDFQKRKRRHFVELRKSSHVNHRLQKAFDEDGEASLSFSVLELVGADELLDAEQRWIDDRSPAYNLARTIGFHIAEETRAKISAALRGRRCAHNGACPHSSQWKVSMSRALRGRVLTPEWRAKLSAAQRRVPAYERTDEHRSRMSVALRSSEVAAKLRTGASRRRTIPSTAGEANGNAKLSAEEVREIRRLSAEPKADCMEIGRRFGVTSTMIRYIRDRKSWRSLE